MDSLCSILSVRELRTLLARVGGVPITLEEVHKFEQLLHNCSMKYTGPLPTVDPSEYETHYDPELVRHDPLRVTPSFPSCSSVLSALLPYTLPFLPSLPPSPSPSPFSHW